MPLSPNQKDLTFHGSFLKLSIDSFPNQEYQ